MPQRLSLVALLIAIPAIGLGVWTSSWWSADGGPISVHAGLKEIKVCAGAVNCQSASYSVLESRISNEQLPVDLATIGSTKSYTWAGSAVFWLSMLGVIPLLLLYKTASDDDIWAPAAFAVLGVFAVTTVLALIFVINKPNAMVRMMPVSIGYSVFVYFAGIIAVFAGTIVELRHSKEMPMASTPTQSARPGVATPTATPTPAGSACPSCGGTPIFNAEVNCSVCRDCGVLI